MRDDVPKVSLAYPPSAKARFMNRKNGLHKRLSRCVLEYRCDLDFVCKLTCRRAGHTANLDGLGARWQFCSLSTEGVSPPWSPPMRNTGKLEGSNETGWGAPWPLPPLLNACVS
jgi:hypothetical protein